MEIKSDVLGTYCQQINKAPLLSPEEELVAAKQVYETRRRTRRTLATDYVLRRV
jgi:hypothetical protein